MVIKKKRKERKLWVLKACCSYVLSEWWIARASFRWNHGPGRDNNRLAADPWVWLSSLHFGSPWCLFMQGFPVLQAYTFISFRIFLPMCWRNLQSLKIPCRRMRMACAPAGTSPRAAWWASWSRRPSCSARWVHTAVPEPGRTLGWIPGAVNVALMAKPVPLHEDICRGVQGKGWPGRL